MNELLHQEHWRIIDQSVSAVYLNALYSFGMDDALCASVGGGIALPTARSWVHNNIIVLGIQDTKLPYLKDGMEYLKTQGYDVIVRNSGGLAVVLDKGVLNLTLVFRDNEKGIDINHGYNAMWMLIKEMFADYRTEINAKEIVGSYCPGSFDLSIGDKKFAGISQRRLRNGVAVQIYLCVKGSGSERAQLVGNFYDISKKAEKTKIEYPDINPSVMASLSELLQEELTIEDVMYRFLNTMKNNCNHLLPGELSSEETLLFESYYKRIIERNEKIFAEQH